MFEVTTHVAPLTRKAQLAYLSVGAALAFALTFSGLQAWFTAPYFQPIETMDPEADAFNRAGLVGVIVFFTFAGLSVALLCEASQYFVRYAFHPANTGREWVAYQHAAVGTQLVLALFFFTTGVSLFVRWAKGPTRCGFLFCLGLEKHPFDLKSIGESFNTFLAIIIFLVVVPLSFVMLYRVYTLWRLQKAVHAVRYTDSETSTSTNEVSDIIADQQDVRDKIFEDGELPAAASKSRCPFQATLANPMAKAPSMRIYEAKPWKKQLSRIVGLCVGIVVCAVLTFWLPNTYEFFCAFGIAHYTQMHISLDTRSDNLTVPEMPYAWFRTSQIEVNSDLVLKIFPGNVFFYAYLLSAAVIVFVLRQSQTGRYWMQRRIPRCACFTYGEAAFMVATAWLTVFFLIYWIRDHNYKMSWTAANPDGLKIENPERWGRGLGQLAILFLSLLLLPIGRQSVLVTVLGVSRDGLLWFHRAIGYAMLAATVAHIVAFYISYYQYGMLWDNLSKIPTIVGRAGVSEDYTIVAATWTTWFMLIAMGIFGLNAVRRRYYELFYYTHLAATYMTLPMMLFHASAGWMYMLPGLTVFAADQLMRLWQRSAVVRVVHARTISEDTVELAFSVPGRWDMRCVHPGQYVLVCVPELTALQWHPFTLASVVEDEAVDGAGATLCTTGTVFYLHIKSMGPRTWTGRLHELVRTGQAFSLGVEGPCGTPVDYSRYDDVVLVAGGIGAAPCVSVYGSLLRAYMRSADGAGVPRVRMVWSTRSASLVGAVADMLQLPVVFRNLVRAPRRRGESRGEEKRAKEQGSGLLGSGRGLLEVNADAKIKQDAFKCDIFVTKAGEVGKFVLVAESAAGGVVGGFREETEEARERDNTGAAASRGGRVCVHEGRPDIGREIAASLTNPATGAVRGDAKRKLVLVCGPESLVTEVVRACARLGVVVHTEEFLF